MKEIWKDIKGYEGLYQVSNTGKVKGLDRNIAYSNGQVRFVKGTLKTIRLSADGYPKVTLSLSSKKKSYSVHRLVAEHFIEKAEEKTEVNHIDGNKLNNNMSNLEWVTSSENMKHAHKNGLIKYCNGEKHLWSKLTENEVFQIIDFLKNTKYYQREIAKFYGVSHTVVSRIKTGNRWKRTTEGVICHQY